MRAPPRSYFESLSTSGPALGDGFTLWADLPEADVPLSARGLGMAGGWGVSGGVMTQDWYYAGTPPLILREPQHERPRPWGWLHVMGGSSRGGCSTFRAGFRGDGGVGRGGKLAVGDVVEPEADAEGILDELGGDAGDSLGYPDVGYKDSAGDF